ncbi:MAG TPA: hypothetical protein VIX89_19190, partial [Bryobacteraceae bacterium]
GVCAIGLADPPALIRMVRNVPTNSSAIQPYVNGKAAAVVLGLRSVSGLQETWLTELHDSFASIEDIDRALIGFQNDPRAGDTFSGYDDVLPASRTMIGLYRAGLSYRSEEAAKGLPKARYLLVSIYRIRPGRDSDFAELVRLRRAHYDTINLDRPEICYQVMSGAPSGTFIFMTPLNSLKSMDDGLARTPPYAEAIRDANATAGRKIAAETEIGHEFLIFRLDPRISYVSDDFSAEDPAFWAPSRAKER